MDEVLRSTEDYAAAYIDDVIIYSSSWVEHLHHLSDVFQRIHRAGLVVNASKCQLAMSEVCYLGYILGGGTIQPQKGVRSYLGLVSWYRHFIPNFSRQLSVRKLSMY